MSKRLEFIKTLEGGEDSNTENLSSKEYRRRLAIGKAINEGNVFIGDLVRRKYGMKPGSPIPENIIIPSEEIKQMIKGSPHEKFYDNLNSFYEYNNQVKDRVAGLDEYGQGKNVNMVDVAWGPKVRGIVTSHEVPAQTTGPSTVPLPSDTLKKRSAFIKTLK